MHAREKPYGHRAIGCQCASHINIKVPRDFMVSHVEPMVLGMLWIASMLGFNPIRISTCILDITYNQHTMTLSP